MLGLSLSMYCVMILDEYELVSYMLGLSLSMYCVMILDEYELWGVVVGIEFQGKFRWTC